MKSIFLQLPSDSRRPLLYAFGLIILSMTTVHADEYVITGVPAGDVLNVRSGASSRHEIVATLKQGDGGITIAGGVVMNGETDWVPISFAGKKGWVRPKYLRKADPDVPNTPQVAISRFKINVGRDMFSVNLPNRRGGGDWENKTARAPEKNGSRTLLFAEIGSSKCVVEAYELGDTKSLSKEEIVESFMSENLMRAALRSAPREQGDVTLFGKKAFAVLLQFNDEEFVGMKIWGRCILQIVCYEPIQGEFYSLYLEDLSPSFLSGNTPEEIMKNLIK